MGQGYDELGCTVIEKWLRGSSTASTTMHAYRPDTVTVTGTAGNKVRERRDGQGRTTRQTLGSGWKPGMTGLR